MKLINEVKRMQQIAGLLKESITGDERSITQAFEDAGINLNLPCTVVDDRGNVDTFDRAQEILTDMENDRKSMEAEDPNFNDQEGINYEFPGVDINAGQGELMGDEIPETEGLTFKLAVTFSDAMMKEIWQ